MSPKIQTLLDQKKIRRSKTRNEIVVRELDAATSDLGAAKMTLKARDYKWATIQAYHAMFHAARALLNRMGYREQNQQGLLAALHQLYEKDIVEKMLGDLSRAMTLTEELHNGLPASESIARAALNGSEDFLEEAARILAAPREWFERSTLRRAHAKTRKR